MEADAAPTEEPLAREGGPGRARHPLVETILLLLLAMGGALAATAVLLGDALAMRVLAGGWRGETPLGTRYTEASWTYLGRPQVVFWLLLLIAGAALWACLLVPLTGALRRRHPPRGLPSLLAPVVLTLPVAGFVASPFLARTPTDFPGQVWKILVLTVLGYLVALVGIGAIWGIQASAAALPDPSKPDESLRLLVELRRSLIGILGLLGAILGAAILATGALQNALRAAGQDPAYEVVIVYGGFFSAVLALVFAPAWERLHRAGSELVEACAPMPSPAAADFGDALDRRTKLRELLQLDVGVGGGLRAGLAILAPLATSLVSLLFSTGR